MIDRILLTPEFNNKISENKDTIRLTDIPYNESLSLFFYEVRTYFEENNLGTIEIISELGDEIDVRQVYNPVTEGAINVKINKTGGTYFITESAFEIFLRNQKTLKLNSEIRLHFTNQVFRSRTTTFLPLKNSTISSTTQVTEEDISPIKFVKPTNKDGQEFMPDSIKSWLTRDEEQAISPNIWKIASTRKLISTLGAEFSILDGDLTLEFKGDRRRSIALPISLETIFLDINLIVFQISDWIFYQSKDIESRHSLFNHQMSILLDDDLTQVDSAELNKKMKNALENSRLAYRYYLSNSSKELGKTLGELNKTLFDYLNKIRQNTADLSSGLWRDFSTVMAVMILNFSIRKSDIVDRYFIFFSIALCSYVSISFYITTSSGFGFYYSLKALLTEWKSKLYSYLSQEEYDNFCLSPLKKAFTRYRTYFFIVLGAYLVLILSVLIIAYAK